MPKARLRRDAHRRALRRFADGLRIGRIVFLTFHEGLDAGGRDQPHIVAQLADLAAPEVGAAAGFDRHHALRQAPEEIEDLLPPQLLAKNGAPCAVSAMQMKHILRQIEPDRGNLRHDRPPSWIVADPPWHTDAVGGRSHHQSPRMGTHSLKVEFPAKAAR